MTILKTLESCCGARGGAIDSLGNCRGPIFSVEWNHGLGVRETAGRWLVLALSSAGLVHDLVKRIVEEHDEGEVELVVLPVSFGDGRYLDSLLTKQI